MDDVLVVVESVLGHTREVAEAVAEGVRREAPSASVRVLGVTQADADQVARAGLLVVGGPTHAFSMSTPRTRDGARDQFHVEPPPEGVREWLARVPALEGRRVAAFDTRVRFPLPGHAAPAIARHLRRRGGRLLVEPEGFLVAGSEGPLVAGELDRAREWGARLASSLASAAVA
ncbi:MAG: flavodoxin family protein [Kineosporiaceae bacterium]